MLRAIEKQTTDDRKQKTEFLLLISDLRLLTSDLCLLIFLVPILRYFRKMGAEMR